MISSIQTKTCSKCKVEKSIDDFYDRRGKKGNSSYCKRCNNDAVVERTYRNKIAAIKYFGSACQKCGYYRCPNALHFHHPDESIKDDQFHRLRNRSLNIILRELEKQKCILLCANCHAEEHYLRPAHRRIHH